MSKEDLYLVLKYKMASTEARIVDTNLKKEKIKDFLSNYLRVSIGSGEDDSKAKVRKEYTIRISCDLSSDTFTTRANTGNNGLTTGIIMHSLNKLNLEGLAQISP